MTVVVGSTTRTLVVNRTKAINTVVERAAPVQTADRSAVNTVISRTSTVGIDSSGVQGPRGKLGPEGDGGVSNFDTDLALLYSVAKL